MYFKYSQKDIDGLIKVAPFMKQLVDHYGKIKRTVYIDLFEALVCTVIGQQINTTLAATFETRLRTLTSIEPKAILALPSPDLKSIGLSQNKVNTIKEIAISVMNGSLNFDRIKKLPNQQVIEELIKIKGIGSWTAQGFLIFGLQRMDVFIPQDLILKKALILLNIQEFNPNLFTPYNTIAAFYLWNLGNQMRVGLSFDSPIGKITLVQENKYIVNCFALEQNIFYAPYETPLLLDAKKQLLEYFSKKRKHFSIPIQIDGSPFRQAILTEMKAIPYGKTCTYKDLAQQANYPLAHRACGQVCNKNPLLIIIPCHRVLNSNKKLHGFAYGLAMKQQLLDLES